MNARPIEDLEQLRRRLRFRSRHRGTKELDILFAGFAEAHLGELDDGQLRRYERLLAIEDPVMLDWLMGRTAPSREAMNDVLRLLLEFAAGPR
jgi:antitoxin CptB